MPPVTRRALLLGVAQGDGTVVNAYQTRITLSNERLIRQLFLLAVDLGERPTLNSGPMGKLATTLPWHLIVGGEPKGHLVHGHYYKVQEVLVTDEEAEVYNFEVEEDHTYIANQVVVHNCFVLTIPDSIRGIFGILALAADIFQSGGGVGYSLSQIRPGGDGVSSGGNASGPLSFLRVFDVMTEVIQQAGKRRGANMATLSVHHPEIRDYIKAKRVEGAFKNFNFSVLISDEFMQAVQEASTYPIRFPPLDASQPARRMEKSQEILAEICQGMWENGEPGLIFIDEINRLHPLPDMVEAVNPCVTGDTLVRTPEGLVPVRNLARMDTVSLELDSRMSKKPSSVSEGIAFRTGVREVFLLDTVEGFQLKLTGDHRVRVRSHGTDHWVPAIELTEGDLVLVGDTPQVRNNYTGGFAHEGETLGWLVGDGSVSNGRGYLYFYGEKKVLSKRFLGHCRKILPNFTSDEAFRDEYSTSIQKNEAHDRESIESARFLPFLESWGLDLGDKRQVPVRLFNANTAAQKGFLSALFSADGTVGGSAEKGGTVRLSSTSPDLLRGVQLLLLNFGIFSKIYFNRSKAEPAMMPNGHGGLKEYNKQATHELVISKRDIILYRDRVGFILEAKQTKLENLLSSYGKRGPYNQRRMARFKSLTLIGEEEVFDITEPVTHSFVANGIVVHNCSETVLLNKESCNLGSINLVKIRDDNELKTIVTKAVRFLDDIIDAQAYPHLEIEDATKATRKIGLGIMGLHGWLLERGIPYASEEGRAAVGNLMTKFNRYAVEASEELARERGPFPRWEDSDWCKQGLPERRNCSVSTVAPTGSISLITDTSSGVEPAIALLGEREYNGEIVDYTFPPFRKFLNSMDPEKAKLVTNWVLEHDRLGACPYLSPKDRKLWAIATEIPWRDHLLMLAEVQKHIEMSISKTINLPHSATIEDIYSIVLESYQLGIKAVTVYRDGSRKAQVYSSSRRKKQRFSELTIPGSTARGKSACGKVFATYNLKGNKPWELFAGMGKGGGCHRAFQEAIGRLGSIAFQHGASIEDVIKQLRGIKCPHPLFLGEDLQIHSCLDAVGRLLEEQSGVEIELEEYEPCPKCGSRMSRGQGCWSCISCGFSTCGG